jgi:hypothetical protein
MPLIYGFLLGVHICNDIVKFRHDILVPVRSRSCLGVKGHFNSSASFLRHCILQMHLAFSPYYKHQDKFHCVEIIHCIPPKKRGGGGDGTKRTIIFHKFMDL